MTDIYINFNLNPFTKLSTSNRSTKFKDFFPLEHLPNDHKDLPNQYANSHKLCDEKVNPLLSLKESQWKLRQQHDQNFLMKGKPL